MSPDDDTQDRDRLVPQDEPPRPHGDPVGYGSVDQDGDPAPAPPEGPQAPKGDDARS